MRYAKHRFILDHPFIDRVYNSPHMSNIIHRELQINVFKYKSTEINDCNIHSMIDNSNKNICFTED